MTFHSDEPAPAWLRATGGVLVTVAVLGIVLVFLFIGRDAPAAAPAVALGVALGGAVGFLLMRARVVVTVSPDTVDLRFWPIFRREIDTADITAVAAVDVSPAEFGGTGLRMAPGGRTGLFFRGGPGVEITTSDGRTYSVVVGDRDALLLALERTSA